MYYLRPDTDLVDLPRKLYIEPTSLCNLNCAICFRHGWIQEAMGHMDYDEVFLPLAQALPDSVEEVFFGGMGEPLFHPRILSMLEALPRGRKVSLLTNGTMLTAQCSADLIRAGLSELWVSMDGFDAQTYESIQSGSSFQRILRNLQAFNEARAGTSVRLGITFVVTPSNVRQLSSINAFADRFQVDVLNISHMIPNGPAAKEETLYDRTDIPVGKMHRLVSQPAPVQDHTCPFIRESAVFVRWDGQVVPCMQLLHSCTTYLYEEKRRITSFTYGTIGRQTLLECWKRPDYAEFRQRVRIFYFPFCITCWGCEDRKENRMDCVYGEAPTCGACLWSTGKIFCP